jgi:hypothetical protein
VKVDCGNGSYEIENWRELMNVIFKVVSYAMTVSACGECKCGCTEKYCKYCAHECY